MPYWVDLSPDWRVFSYLTALCVTTAVVFGLAPAVHLLKTRLNNALRDGARGIGAGLRARRWTQLLVVGELALALVLLAAAGFMTRSAFELYGRGHAFDTANLITMRFSLPASTYPAADDRRMLIERLENRLAANPAVASATITSILPFLPGGARREISRDARTAADAGVPSATYIYTDARYFQTLGVPLLRGQAFTALDEAAGQDSVIVNQQFASTFLPGVDPVGQRIYLRDPIRRGAPFTPATVVGVSPTIPQFPIPSAPGNPPESVVYAPLQRDPNAPATVSLIVRGRGDEPAAIDAVRQELRALDPDLPVYFVRSMEDTAAEMQFQVQWMLRLFGFFAAIAFVLAAVGLYGVASHAVTQRTAEIGVRMALGAQRQQVVWLFMRRALVQVGIGLAIGLAAAFAVGRLLESVQLQANAHDPLTYIAVAALLVIVSCAAALVPARRAARLDPAVTLRYE